MDRRSYLKSSLLLSGAFAFPALPGFAIAEKGLEKQLEHKGLVLKMNDLEIMFFSDGHVLLEKAQPIFAPQINALEFDKKLKDLYLSTNSSLDLAINVMLIKKGNRLILIDTGSGKHFGKNEGWLSDNLKNAGINPDDITDIFITHAHRDHIGGIITKQGDMVYQNANYYLAKTEYDFWMSEFAKNKLDKDRTSKGLPLTQKILNKINNRITFFDYGTVLFDCLHTELAEGHTPGHTIFTLFSKDKSIKNTVDTFHSPVLINKPFWGTQWDVDFELGIKTRLRILEESFVGNHLLMSAHLPWPGLGYIGKKNEEYFWIPLPLSNPYEIKL